MRSRRRVTAFAAAALMATVGLSACATPTGVEVEECPATFELRDPQIVQPGGDGETAVAIDCIRQIERRRLRIGYSYPAGPDCYALSRVAVVESADAVSITLYVSRRNDDIGAGPCPPEPRRAGTEIDLQAPVADRTLLDGSR